MNFKNTLSILLLITILHSCSVFKPTQSSENKLTSIYLYQNGKEELIGNKIQVERKKFSLRFYNKRKNPKMGKFYSVQIAAFLNIEELNKITTEKPTSEFNCFEPGSGMAAPRGENYESLIFTNKGHHYLFYENAKSKRLNLIKDLGEYLKLEFEINSLNSNGNTEKMEETHLQKFYLAILIDRNLNRIIDKGELYKIEIKIK